MQATVCIIGTELIEKEISLENVALITNFLGGVDEDWFVTIHVCIENAAKNIPITAACEISKLKSNKNKKLEYG